MHNVAYKIAAVAALALSFAGTASAQTNWDSAHPRRVEANHRLANQDRRIHHEVREGDMSHAEAARLHRDDRQVRQKERDMATHDGGHITRREDYALNQQENHLSRQIGQ
jgi:ketosteroid isomerase-like protein